MRYRRDPLGGVIDWFDYRVSGDPMSHARIRGPRLRRAWRRHRPWIGRVLVVLAVLGVVALLTSSRRRRGGWL